METSLCSETVLDLSKNINIKGNEHYSLDPRKLKVMDSRRQFDFKLLDLALCFFQKYNVN